ncbi:hypothetical protein BC833DRAFT_53572 [Globomyces pollinis-pini]|nr:hypothetical protein BC833DRAFT_53572 [Globomyces pollinis-pini]
MIHKENGSELAGLIRKCIDLTRLETASDYQTLKEGLNENFDYWIQHWNLCVVDIGINKLKRDYYHYFVHSQLCVWDDLSPFFVSDDPSQLVRYLYKLQSVYELYVLIQSNVLMFPFEIMRMVIQTALKHCLESDDDCVRFQISIPKYQVNCTKLVHAFIDNFQASCWRMVWEADGRWFVQLERVEGMDVELDTDPDSYLVDSIAWKVKYGCSRMV